MGIFIKDDGAWKDSSLYVKDDGAWKKPKEVWVRDSGVWKKASSTRLEWEFSPIPYTAPVSANAVRFANDLWVLTPNGINNARHIATSVDGINWTVPSHSTGTGAVNDAQYGGENWVITTGNAAYYSPDAQAPWTQTSSLGISSSSSAGACAYGAGVWVICASISANRNLLLVSSLDEFTSWTFRLDNTTYAFHDIAFGNGTFVVVCPDGIIRYNKNITSSSWPTATSGVSVWLMGVSFLDGQFVAVGGNETILTSPDGVEWTVRHVGATTRHFRAVAGGDGMYVAVGGNGLIASSPDLINWEVQEYDEFSNNISTIAYGNGVWKFLTIGTVDSIPKSGIFTAVNPNI